MTLKEMLETAAGRYGGKAAVTLGGRRLAYTELDRSSNKVANALIEMGVGRGHRVAMLLTNSLEFVVIYFGIVKTGAIAVPLDTKYKTNELACLFDSCRPKVLVTESPYLELVTPLLSRFNYIENIITLGPDDNGQFLSYHQIMANSSARPVAAVVEADDVAHIAYTSGPTLRPRGAMLVHRHLVAAAGISAAGFGQTDKDVVVLFALPMHHAVGLVVILLTSIYKGSKVVMLPGLSISGLMETIEREKATIFMGVPFIHALLIREAETAGIRHDLDSLRVCASAGSPLPVDTMKRFQELFSKRLIQFYGLTEATVHVTCQPIDGSGKLGSVGRALPTWQLKIVDDDGRVLGPNQPGEIAVKGPFMKGYYNNPQATAEAIRDGWLHTGDIARLDEEGCLFLSGLKKPMLISKGQNIYYSDVETVLSAHHKVAEVAVVGVADPDGMRGEVVRAVIRLKAGETAAEPEIKRFCLERLANYKVPKQVIFLDSLPKTAAGNINREVLKGDLLTVSSVDRAAGEMVL